MLKPINEDAYVGYIDNYDSVHLWKKYARKDTESAESVACHAGLSLVNGSDRFVFFPDRKTITWWEESEASKKEQIINTIVRKFELPEHLIKQKVLTRVYS